MSEYQFFLASRHADILTASTGKDDLISPAGGAISGYNANATAIPAATSTKDQGGLLPKQGSGRVEKQLVAHLAQSSDVKMLTAQMSRQSYAISNQETTLTAAQEAIDVLPQSGRQTDQQLAHKIAAIQASPVDKVTNLPKMQFLTDDTALKTSTLAGVSRVTTPVIKDQAPNSEASNPVTMLSSDVAKPIARSEDAMLIGEQRIFTLFSTTEARSDDVKNQLQNLIPSIMGHPYIPEYNQAWLDGTANAIEAGNYSISQARQDLAHCPEALDTLQNMIPSIMGHPYMPEYNQAWLDGTANAIGAGNYSISQARQDLAHCPEALDTLQNLIPSIMGHPYMPEYNQAWRDGTANAIGAGNYSISQARQDLAHCPEALDTLQNLIPSIMGHPYMPEYNQAWRDGTANAIGAGNYSISQARQDLAYCPEAHDVLQNVGATVLGRALTQTEISSYQTELANGKSLNDLRNNHFATTVSSIFSDPSLDGPNLAMNTQGVVNGQIQYSDKHSTLNGGSSPDWGVIQWRGQSALNPEAGTSSQVWDKKYGNSIGHWTQGSANSMAGKTDYNVFRDPKNGHYVYQMAAQGGNLLDVQLSTLGSVDNQYSFSHQITASFNQGISDYHGNTGSYQAGINFTINYHSNNLNFGIFLQFVSIDSVGQPQAYISLPKSLGGSIYNFSGSQADYINPTLPSNDGVMYSTTINLNQGLMAAIKAIVGLYPQYSEIENLNNWYLNGSYIGVESTNGTGSSSDVTGKYNVEDLKITYDKSKYVSYSDRSTTAPIMSMQKLA
ncbi:hypothetical protein ABHV46_13110 [Asaia sp. BMEF1]|uniref:hypothetical protein n=1 Tax=Asaia sp. BMEF1 TaxID=3155932 RepID=UPI003F6732AE